jgi:hypothetical protein
MNTELDKKPNALRKKLKILLSIVPTRELTITLSIGVRTPHQALVFEHGLERQHLHW